MRSAHAARPSPIDPDEFAVFREEAQEQVAEFREAIEQLVGGDATAVDAAFRAVHTLKGSAATAGHGGLVRVAHGAETVLAKLRAAGALPGPALSGVLREAAETLAGFAEEDIDDAWSISAPGVEGRMAAALSSGERPRMLPSRRRARTVSLAFEVTLSPDAEPRGVRVLQALQELDTLGRVADLVPGREEIEAGHGGRTLAGTLTSRVAAEEIPARLRSISGVTGVALVPMADEERTGARMARAQLTVVRPGNVRDEVRRDASIDEARLERLAALSAGILGQSSRLTVIAHSLEHAGEVGAARTLALQVGNAARALARAASDLGEEVRRARLTTLEPTFVRLTRVAEECATANGRDVQVVLIGGEVECGHKTSRAVTAALLQLVRNAVAHGIELPGERMSTGKPPRGTLKISACRERDGIRIEVSDDGRGIDVGALQRRARRGGFGRQAEVVQEGVDRAAIDLAFLPGLSTARRVTGLAGRGVGMDIVRTAIEGLGGQIELSTRPGEGTSCTLRIPAEADRTGAWRDGDA